MTARQKPKPTLSAEAAYENAHLVAQDLLVNGSGPAEAATWPGA